jgi:hypothetical protein
VLWHAAEGQRWRRLFYSMKRTSKAGFGVYAFARRKRKHAKALVRLRLTEGHGPVDGGSLLCRPWRRRPVGWPGPSWADCGNRERLEWARQLKDWADWISQFD